MEPKSLTELTANVVSSLAKSKPLGTNDIISLLSSFFSVLQELESLEKEHNKPPFPLFCNPMTSIEDDTIICMVCGVRLKSLTQKHLDFHNLTPKKYRAKFGFPPKTKLCCISVTEKRVRSAKKRGLPENLRKAVERKKRLI